MSWMSFQYLFIRWIHLEKQCYIIDSFDQHLGKPTGAKTSVFIKFLGGGGWGDGGQTRLQEFMF